MTKKKRKRRHRGKQLNQLNFDGNTLKVHVCGVVGCQVRFQYLDRTIFIAQSRPRSESHNIYKKL